MTAGTRQWRIIRLLDDHTVVVNVGERDGVEPGMRLGIYSPLDDIVDPVTGETLGDYRRRKGVVSVTEVQERFCIAETPRVRQQVEERGMPLFGSVKRTEMIQRSLNIADEHIRDVPGGETVVVGDIVEIITKPPSS
jgi:hypothetical protein